MGKNPRQFFEPSTPLCFYPTNVSCTTVSIVFALRLFFFQSTTLLTQTIQPSSPYTSPPFRQPHGTQCYGDLPPLPYQTQHITMHAQFRAHCNICNCEQAFTTTLGVRFCAQCETQVRVRARTPAHGTTWRQARLFEQEALTEGRYPHKDDAHGAYFVCIVRQGGAVVNHLLSEESLLLKSKAQAAAPPPPSPPPPQQQQQPLQVHHEVQRQKPLFQAKRGVRFAAVPKVSARHEIDKKRAAAALEAGAAGQRNAKLRRIDITPVAGASERIAERKRLLEERRRPPQPNAMTAENLELVPKIDHSLLLKERSYAAACVEHLNNKLPYVCGVCCTPTQHDDYASLRRCKPAFPYQETGPKQYTEEERKLIFGPTDFFGVHLSKEMAQAYNTHGAVVENGSMQKERIHAHQQRAGKDMNREVGGLMRPEAPEERPIVLE